MEMKLFVFSVEDFKFSKFHDDKAKQDKHKFIVGFDRGIRGKKPVPKNTKIDLKFSNLLFWGQVTNLFTNFIRYK